MKIQIFSILAGLIYAREIGNLREFEQFDQGQGPLYVVNGSFSDQLFSKMLDSDVFD